MVKEIITKELMEQKSVELFNNEHSEANKKLIKNIVKQITECCGSNFVLHNVDIVKVESNDNTTPCIYGLFFREWDGKQKFLPLSKNMTIEDIIFFKDRILERLVFNEICNKKEAKLKDFIFK